MSEEKQMVVRKPWEQFRRTGLLLFINQILHVFGWAIVFEYDKDSNPPQLKSVYPARVRFRGFSSIHVEESYRAMTDYLKENIDALKEEIK